MERENENRPRREDGPRREERAPRHFRGDARRPDLRGDGPRPPRPRFEDKPGRPEKPQRPFRPRRPRELQKTKMFTSKDELVAFVNEKGEEGHRIDVYKIEDELYKVVICERPKDEVE